MTMNSYFDIIMKKIHIDIYSYKSYIMFFTGQENELDKVFFIVQITNVIVVTFDWEKK